MNYLYLNRPLSVFDAMAFDLVPKLGFIGAGLAFPVVSWLGRKIYPTIAGNPERMNLAERIAGFEDMSSMKKLLCKIAILATGVLTGMLVAAAAEVSSDGGVSPSLRPHYYFSLTLACAGSGLLIGMNYNREIQRKLLDLKKKHEAALRLESRLAEVESRLAENSAGGR